MEEGEAGAVKMTGAVSFNALAQSNLEIISGVASFQVQAQAPSRVQREISIPLQICISAGKGQPCHVIPLHRRRSKSGALQVPVWVQIPLALTLSVAILGWAQVQSTLEASALSAVCHCEMDLQWSFVQSFSFFFFFLFLT